MTELGLTPAMETETAAIATVEISPAEMIPGEIRTSDVDAVNAGVMAADPGAARTPGRPRSTRANEAIIEAVLGLMGEGLTIEALSMEAIAARAGVGKATIYRRWPNKDTLVLEALLTLKGKPVQPVGDSVRADLIRMLSPVGQKDDRALKVMPCLVPEVLRSPAAYRIWQEMTEPRREVLRLVLRRGVANGELRADLDVELAVALLASPVVLHRLMRWNPRLDDDALPGQIVDMVLTGISAPGASADA